MKKIIYWLSTAIFGAVFLFSAWMYLAKYGMVEDFYEHLGFPSWIIYPSAIAKVVAVILIVIGKPKVIVEWAYAGLFFDAILATTAHHFAGDGIIGLSFFALVAILLSRYFLDARYNSSRTVE